MSRDRSDFIRDIIDADLSSGVHQRVATRFPPEPNGYLHIGHAKSICLNFGLAADYKGTCNLRYDDTNPTKEDVEYVESIEADVRWLGFSPSSVLFSADYFGRMFQWAEKLVNAGKAYVCDLNDEDIRAYRGSLSEPGRPSPGRQRSAAENLALLHRMRAGEFPDGACTLRAKIDMSSANMKMRDPLLYRIRHAHHHRSGDQWCIYPMYDFAHPLEDAIEGITHSICTLEFENNRDVYNWVLEHTGAAADCGFAKAPTQYEFARLALDYTVMSKRKLLQLVTGKHVDGWNDPRMPTIAGMRRRGYSAAAIRAFCEMIGVAKANSTVDIGKLEYCLRDDLNHDAPRALAVVAPLRFEITNWVEMLASGAETSIDAPYFPSDVGKPGSRSVPFGEALFIEQEDFSLQPTADFHRLGPGRTVRLRYAYCITCDEVITDEKGAVIKLRGRVHPDSGAGTKPAGPQKVWGVIHWVDAATSVPAQLRLYDRLFSVAKPEEGGADYLNHINPQSLQVVADARLEQSMASAAAGSRWQFERCGYFVMDAVDSKPGALVCNRIITLRDATIAATTAPVVAEVDAPKQRNTKSTTRPKNKSPSEFRQEARNRDPQLQAHFETIAGLLDGNNGDADLLTADIDSAEYFLSCAQRSGAPAITAKWMINELPRFIGNAPFKTSPFDVDRFSRVIAKLATQELSNGVAKQVLAAMITPAQVASSLDELISMFTKDKHLGSVSVSVAQVIASNPDKVAQYQSGKTGLLGFFVGQVIRGNPQFAAAEVNRLVIDALRK